MLQYNTTFPHNNNNAACISYIVYAYSRSPEQVYRDLLQRHFIFAFDQTDIDIKLA